MHNGDESSNIDETLRYFAGGPRCGWTGKVLTLCRCPNACYTKSSYAFFALPLSVPIAEDHVGLSQRRRHSQGLHWRIYTNFRNF